MELKEFIKTALTDIVTAVKETQESVQEFATIAPITEAGNKVTHIKTPHGYAEISNIDFDVAVTTETTEGTANGIKGGITVAGVFNIGGNGKEETAEKFQNVSRMKFTISVLLPHASSLEEEVLIKDGARHKSVTRREFQNMSDQ